ncbi:HIT finger domain-containing protein [Phyllosticta capitalensis]
MPHIEVIPITHGGPAPAPGWAYVPDIGYDPSKAAINPSGRKRTAARQSQREADAYNAGSGGNAISDLPARQQTAILKRIAELDRDNQKDVALPQARGGAAASGAGTVSKREREGRKMTPAVRKILQSGRTFAHWLADEEALAAQRTGVVGAASASMGAAAVGRAAKRAAAATATATDSAPTTPLANAVGSPAPPPQQTLVVDLESGIQQHHDPPDDDEPLLRPTVPQLPTEAEIQTLLAHPPLPYSAARAAPPGADGASRRLFCEICGYWGRVRCLRCAARICGLECKRAHDETSCLRM